MSRQEKSKQSKGGHTLWRGVVLMAAVLVAVTLATAARARTAAGMSSAEGDEVQIVLGTAGFTPAEVSHAAGAFAIAVDNQGVTDEYVLQLKSAGGALLNEITVQKGSVVWTVDLPAGVYTLTVAGHPDWLCQITVQ